MTRTLSFANDAAPGFEDDRFKDIEKIQSSGLVVADSSVCSLFPSAASGFGPYHWHIAQVQLAACCGLCNSIGSAVRRCLCGRTVGVNATLTDVTSRFQRRVRHFRFGLHHCSRIHRILPMHM